MCQFILLNNNLDTTNTNLETANSNINNLIQNEIIGSGSYPAVSCANMTGTLVASQSLYAGFWLILFGGAFAIPTKGPGHRRLVLTSSSTWPGGNRSRPSFPAVSGDQTSLAFAQTFQYTQDAPIYLYAQQNSGTALDFYPFIQAICLKKF